MSSQGGAPAIHKQSHYYRLAEAWTFSLGNTFCVCHIYCNSLLPGKVGNKTKQTRTVENTLFSACSASKPNLSEETNIKQNVLYLFLQKDLKRYYFLPGRFVSYRRDVISLFHFRETFTSYFPHLYLSKKYYVRHNKTCLVASENPVCIVQGRHWL